MNEPFEIHKSPGETDDDLQAAICLACDRMEKIYSSGYYPKLMVERSWSKHNPEISGEIARPSAYRWYLSRELLRLVKN